MRRTTRSRAKIYNIRLSPRGLVNFKGGNVEPMSKPLGKFEAKNDLQARRKFSQKIAEDVGSASEMFYKLDKIKE